MPLRDTLEHIRAAPDPPNEETAKLQILVPILQELGWNLARQELIFEYPAGGKRGGRIDIALRGPDRVVAFIEAKAPRVGLDRHVEQVVKYAFHEGVDICVLTNGLEWWLYLPMLPVPFEERRFETLRTRTDSGAKLQGDLENFLSRENLLCGRALELARERFELRELENLNEKVRRVWRDMLKGADRALVDLVCQRVNDSVGFRPTQDQVADVIRRSETDTETPNYPDRSPNPPSEPIRFSLWGKTHQVSHWIRLLLFILAELHKQHGDTEFASRLDRLVSRNRGEFTRPVQVGSTGFYINRSIPVTEIRRRSYACLERFGYARSDLDILSD